MTPWPQRDDHPVVLVTLDGLGDRPCRELSGRTPAEVARTPVLDALIARGAGGVHVPFGPGWATSSERAHWAMFGLGHVTFPGRAALELLGVGGQPPRATPMWHLAIRRGHRLSQIDAPAHGAMVITGRLGRDEVDVSAAAHSVLADYCASTRIGGISFEVVSLRAGEWVLIAHGASSHEISDTDPLFDHVHPWMRPVVLREAEAAGGARCHAAQTMAAAMQEFLLGAHNALRHSGIEYDVPTTKWASSLDADVSYSGEVGVTGAMVTSSALYRGLARYLDMSEIDVAAPAGDLALGLAARVEVARTLLDGSDRDASDRIDFIHVHTKAPDEAGHTKDPHAKIAAIEACDSALGPLVDLLDHTDFVLAVTGDHATPSDTTLLHSGDPTPFIVAGPDVRIDAVREFGETALLSGSLGRLRAADIAPLLHGLARRPFFIGHRPGPLISPALPSAPEWMPHIAPASADSSYPDVTAFDPPRSIHPPTHEESHA